MSTQLAFNNFKIGARIFAISGAAITGFLILFALEYYGYEQDLKNSAVQEHITERLTLVRNISEDFLNARRREKDFLIRLEDKYINKHNKISDKIKTDLKELEALEDGVEREDTGNLMRAYQDYQDQFHRLASDWQTLGQNEKAGLRGKLRQAVQGVEKTIKEHATNDLMVKLLMMRRHEKDFIIRKTPKYIDRVAKRIEEFEIILATKELEPKIKQDILTGLEAYHKSFLDFSKLTLSIKDKRNGLSKLYSIAEPQLNKLRAEIENDYKEIKKEIITSSENFFYAMSAIMAVIALISVTFGMLIGRSVYKPLRHITDQMTLLAKGDKSIKVDTDGKDEISDMAKAVIVFKDNMIKAERLVAEQKEAQDKQLTRAENLEALTNEFEATISELVQMLSSASTELHTTASNMTDIAKESQSQSQSMAESSDTTSTNIQSVAASTEELSTSIRELSTQVQSTSQSTKVATEEVDAAAKQIEGLLQASEKIGGVVELISELAEQTNLLALNATIESARAGDAGKGFAVVASEVKKLAQETTNATTKIQGEVTIVQNEIKATVSSIKSIETKITSVDKATGSIAAAVEEQTAATDEISRVTLVSANSMEDLNKNALNVSEGAKQTETAATGVLQSSEELSRQTNILQRKVTEFIQAIKTA